MNPVLKRLLLSQSGIIRNGLTAEYRFNEGAGTILHDYSGNNYHGIFGDGSDPTTDNPTWIASGLSFDGGDFVTIGAIAGNNIKTIQIAFYVASAVGALTTGMDIIATPGFIGLGAITSSLTDEIITVGDATAGRSAWCDAAGTVPAGWNIIDITWSGAQYNIWLNGAAKPITVYGTPVVLNSTSVYLGQNAAGSARFTGYEGYATIYNRSLIESELAHNRKYIKKAMQSRGATTNW